MILLSLFFLLSYLTLLHRARLAPLLDVECACLWWGAPLLHLLFLFSRGALSGMKQFCQRRTFTRKLCMKADGAADLYDSHSLGCMALFIFPPSFHLVLKVMPAMSGEMFLRLLPLALGLAIGYPALCSSRFFMFQRSSFPAHCILPGCRLLR